MLPGVQLSFKFISSLDMMGYVTTVLSQGDVLSDQCGADLLQGILNPFMGAHLNSFNTVLRGESPVSAKI